MSNKAKCDICYNISNCLQFPCCNNKFNICTFCLLKSPKTCPQCRTPYKVEHKDIKKVNIRFIINIITSTIITTVLHIITSKIITTVLHIIIFIISIYRTDSCYDQPCETNKPNTCPCPTEIMDAICIPIIYMTTMVPTFMFKNISDIINVISTINTVIYLLISPHYKTYGDNNYQAPFLSGYVSIIILEIALIILTAIIIYIPTIARNCKKCTIKNCYKTNYEPKNIVTIKEEPVEIEGQLNINSPEDIQLIIEGQVNINNPEVNNPESIQIIKDNQVDINDGVINPESIQLIIK